MTMADQNEQYIDSGTLKAALRRLNGTSDHLLKIWLTLKQMGLRDGSPPVLVTTSSPNDALVRLFSYGDPNGGLYVPFSHTRRFMTMASDAGRSIIQTTIQRWKSSGSVVTCDPTSFLKISDDSEGQLLVGTTRSYPIGLGLGKDGFALDDGQRVSIPATSFAVWYYRQTVIPSSVASTDVSSYLVSQMPEDLNLSPAEFEAVFIDDDITITTSVSSLTDENIFSICSEFMDNPGQAITEIQNEDFSSHSLRIRSMKTVTDKPSWLNRPPEDLLKELIDKGASAILLYGPPRTGKTRVIDALISRSDSDRQTIQIHDGWNYDNLIQGFRPDSDGTWTWVTGPLKKAIEEGKKFIVLEEINRTQFTQALGEVFSLVEAVYRGEDNAIQLRSGASFYIPLDTVFIMTMNTLDRSTEDIDDAMMGRFAAVEFPPKVESLVEILQAQNIESSISDKIRDLFAFILDYYPLGHGYFASLDPTWDPISYYTTKIRPVLANHFRDYHPENLDLIDNKVDDLFG